MRVSFKTKLLGLCGFMGLVSVVIALVSFNGLQRMDSEYNEITQEKVPQVEDLYEMFLHYRFVRIN